MIEKKLKDFLDKQVYDFGNFKYSLEKEEEYTYVLFSQIFAEENSKELTFKLINENLYLHTTTYGWKPVEKGSANKYFWIELLSKD